MMKRALDKEDIWVFCSTGTHIIPVTPELLSYGETCGVLLICEMHPADCKDQHWRKYRVCWINSTKMVNFEHSVIGLADHGFLREFFHSSGDALASLWGLWFSSLSHALDMTNISSLQFNLKFNSKNTEKSTANILHLNGHALGWGFIHRQSTK